MTRRKKSKSVQLTIRTLRRGWYDKDEVILHAVFQLLVDFVEQEHPDKHIDWNHDAVHRRAWKEIRDLYRWWTAVRFSRRGPLDDERIAKPPLRFNKVKGTKFRRLATPNKKKYAAYYRALKKQGRLEEQWHDEDQRKLHRLVEIRDFLWT
jgi:hypothetical protein